MEARVLWITGLPGSGKSALADELRKQIPELVVLRMDELRKIATPEPTYSEAEREVLYRSLVYMAGRLACLGHDVIIDATANLRRWRDLARERIPRYAEVYLTCPAAALRQRESSRVDRRGAPPDIYKKGKAGWPVPGVGAPYEEPLWPELTFDTSKLSINEEADAVLDLLNRM